LICIIFSDIICIIPEIIKKENKYMEEIKIYVKDEKGLELPFYAHEGDAGMDVRATEDILIAPGETKIIKTGLKMAIPEGYEIQVRPRSGASLKTKLRVANAPGTVDCGYRDEVGVIMNNTSRDYYWEGENIKKMPQNDDFTFTIDTKGNKDGYYLIKKGDRVAQLVLCKIYKANFELVDDVSNIGKDRGGGYGHSGMN
jgi:dUTP pyrophosphatase